MNRPKTINTLGAAWAAAMALTSFAGTALPVSAAEKMDAALAQKTTAHVSGYVSAIAHLNGPLTPARSAQLRALGASVTSDLPIISSITVRLPAHCLQQLAALPFVTHLSYDGVVTKSDAFTVASSGAGATYSQYKLDGTGVGVAVLDSGVHFTNDLAQTLQGGPARITDNVVFGSTGTDDFCGHGTHVSGIIAGNGAASTGKLCFNTFYGVARNAQIVNVKVLNTQGAGDVSSVVAGIQWVVANRNAVLNGKPLNIRVMNLSLGHPVGESYTTDPLCQAVEAAWRAGIVVVCAAGNDGRVNATQTSGAANEGWGTAYGSIQSPGNDPYVITVGATKQSILSSGAKDSNRADDRVATYSGRGPSRLDLVCKPDILAPGNLVISTNTNNSYLAQNYGATNQIPYSAYSTQNAGRLSQDYFCLSGTSMATPVVAGAAALILQKYPTLTPDTVKARLMLSADKLAGWNDANGNYDACTYGAGYLDIPAALASTFVVSGEYAISPSLSIDANGNVAVNDDHALWGTTTVLNDHALWGSHALWGTNGVTDLHALWGSHALWGTNELASSHALWGCSVWNDHALWGCTSSAVDLSSIAIKGE